MHMIELKKDGLTFAVNADFVSGVVPHNLRGKNGNGCDVYIAGDNKPYSCDNSYDEVMRMLPESTVPAPADVRNWPSPWDDDDADDILASDPEEE